MVKSIALTLGFIALGVVGITGYLNGVSGNIIIVRSIGAFFLFYFIGQIVGVIVVKNTLEIFEKKRLLALELEKRDKEAKLKQKKDELSKNIAGGISEMMKE